MCGHVNEFLSNKAGAIQLFSRPMSAWSWSPLQLTVPFLEKAWVLTKKENKLKPVFHNREYNWPPWLVGWQSRIRIPSTWWNFLEHKRQPWSYTQGFWTAMYVTQYHYETVSQNSYLTLLGWRSFFYNWVECLNDLNRIMGTTRTVTLNAAKD